MDRRRALTGFTLLAATALAATGIARAQSGAVVIGLLDGGQRDEWWDAFRKQMSALGYVEGRNVTYVSRFAKGSLDELPALAKDLVAQKVALIVTGGSAAAVAAQRATRKIPIVMGSGTDQVSLGLASTLSRPGGNVTGLSSLNSELTVKRVELLREVVPKASRVAVLWHADNPGSGSSVRDLVAWTAKARVALQSFGVHAEDELADAFAAMSRERVDVLAVVTGPFVFGVRKRVAELAIKHRLPAMYGAAEYVEAGGLMSYAPSYTDLFRRAATYVDRILKGGNPATMAIEQPATFELVINAGSARAIGVTFPATLLARASRIVD